MKRLLTLAIMAAFILGTVGMAQAVEIQAKGTWRVNFNYLKNADSFDSDSEVDKFRAVQRMRTLFEFVASENLKGVLHLEIGNLTWGGGGAGGAGNARGGALNADGVNVATKNAFIQFNVPGTGAAIKAGIQGFALPSTYGSHILSADVAALAAIIPFNEMMGLTVAWARPYDVTQGTFETKIEDEVDVFAAVLPISLDGVTLNPFAVYARWGKDFLNDTFGAGVQPNPFRNANQWFAGLNFTVDMLDPIVFFGDFNYGHVKLTDDRKFSGFIADLAVQYRMPMMTPELFFLYESGEDSKYSRGGDSKRMPTIGTDGASWAPTAFGMTGSSFGGGVDGILRSFIAGLPGATPLDSYWAVEGTLGMWALGAKLGDISFIDRLSHDLIFLYAKGTNDTANAQLFTSDDKYYEVTFDSNYQIYENLVARLELGWGKLDLDDLTSGSGRSDLAKDSAWKVSGGFIYRF
ncbi:outer membrane homotrimeric porin [Desulfonatronum parangueonense]